MQEPVYICIFTYMHMYICRERERVRERERERVRESERERECARTKERKRERERVCVVDVFNIRGGECLFIVRGSEEFLRTHAKTSLPLVFFLSVIQPVIQRKNKPWNYNSWDL